MPDFILANGDVLKEAPPDEIPVWVNPDVEVGDVILIARSRATIKLGLDGNHFRVTGLPEDGDEWYTVCSTLDFEAGDHEIRLPRSIPFEKVGE